MKGVLVLPSPIAALGTWWLGQFEKAWPRSLNARDAPRRMRLVIHPDEHEVEIALLGTTDEEIFVERSGWAEYKRSVFDRCLRKAATLARPGGFLVSLSVPRAIGGVMLVPGQAKANVKDIVREHVSQKTPLRPDDVFMGWDASPAGGGKLEIRYLVLPQTLLDRILERLSISTDEISTLEGPEAEGTMISVPLRPGQDAGVPMAGRAARSLAVASFVLAIFGISGLGIRQAAMLAEMDEELVQVAAPARQSAHRLRAVYAMADDMVHLGKLRGAAGVARIWEELARVLPNSTFLTEIEVGSGSVQVSGLSASAPELIHRLEASPLLQDVSFAGPVVLDRAAGKERFTLRAALRQARNPGEERE